MRPRKFWRDEYDGSFSPGWAITFVTVLLMAFGLFTYWINDMHMYHYGLFGPR
ncbi:MAG: hypothetical protein ACRDM0_09120 [Thermoleophilaceae bacterium]